MRRIVLPLTATDIRAIATADVVHTVTAANVRVAVEVVIHVYVYIAAAPTGTRTFRGAIERILAATGAVGINGNTTRRIVVVRHTATGAPQIDSVVPPAVILWAIDNEQHKET